jgi:hypothetical protein
MSKIDRPTFIVHFRPERDCTNPIGALRELLKRALRSWGLRCTHAQEIPTPESAENRQGISPAANYAQEGDTL